MIENETNKDASVSRISARTGLLTEFVEFLENSMPEMITVLISVVGILAIIATLNINVFFCLPFTTRPHCSYLYHNWKTQL